mgnify:CR=1 FL=1
MIPLLLIAGFLGSGKTTLLRRIAARRGGRRLLFLINEFSAVDVDGALARSAAGDAVVTVAGGSIFCRCKVTEFIETLSALRDRVRAEGIEGVVVEASGMADPRAMTRLLRETRIESDYRLARIVVVVDPGRYLKVRRGLPAVEAQVGAADLILLNKCDVYDAETLSAAEAAVREANPSAGILRSMQADVEFEWFPAAPRAIRTAGEYAPCRDPHFETLVLDPGPAPEFERWRAALQAVRSDLYRVKGIVRRGGGRLRLWEDAGQGLTDAAAPDGVAAAPMVVICRGGAGDRVRAACERAD